MSDQQSKPPVNDISHLFLSNVREIAGEGRPRPQRIPPGGQRVESPAPVMPPVQDQQHDLSAEEYAEVLGGDEVNDAELSEGPADVATASDTQIAPVTALLASHLSGRQLERARDY